MVTQGNIFLFSHLSCFKFDLSLELQEILVDNSDDVFDFKHIELQFPELYFGGL